MTVPKRFAILRLLGWVLKVLAWIILVVTTLLAIFAGIAAGGAGLQLDAMIPAGSGLDQALALMSNGVVTGVLFFLIGLIYFLILYASGESLHMQLAIEENTRLTAALLLRMHQESQQDNRSYGSSGFESERFDR